MTIASFIEDEEAVAACAERSRNRNFAADLRQAGVAVALLFASLLCLWSVNDFRTSLSLLHSAANLWPLRRT